TGRGGDKPADDHHVVILHADDRARFLHVDHRCRNDQVAAAVSLLIDLFEVGGDGNHREQNGAIGGDDRSYTHGDARQHIAAIVGFNAVDLAADFTVVHPLGPERGDAAGGD